MKPGGTNYESLPGSASLPVKVSPVSGLLLMNGLALAGSVIYR
jgi:hypothetical protein